jgi:hypothetical protein
LWQFLHGRNSAPGRQGIDEAQGEDHQEAGGRAERYRHRWHDLDDGDAMKLKVKIIKKPAAEQSGIAIVGIT